MCSVRAAARICSEAGAWVTTNTCVADLSIPSVHRLDDRRIRGHCQWPAIVGRVPACSRHDPSFPARTGGTTSSVQRSICGGSPARCPPPQRTNLPRTRCGWSMSFGRSCSRNWGALERRDLRLLANHRARQTPALLRQAVSAALLHRWSALLCHAASSAYAASLQGLDSTSRTNIASNFPSISNLLGHGPLDFAGPSRLPPNPP
jgi:hypothetical protein